MRLTRRRALVLLGAALGGACSPAQPPAPTPTVPAPLPTASVPTPLPTATAPPALTATKPAPLPTPTAPTPTATSDMQTAAEPTAMPRADLPVTQTTVLPGIDVLIQQHKDFLAGRRLGLVTNATGRARAGESTIDLLYGESKGKLLALFSPEHGIRGEAAAGQSVDSSVDATTGLPIYSLYGDTTRPTDAMLRGLDTLVYDIQDVGARPYTYTSTLLELMQAAAAHTIPVVVLDRPDPIGGDQVEGSVLDPRFSSFVGPAPIPMRYGLTIGELGQFFNGELGVGADLTVVRVQGWSRAQWFDQTGLEWINPSPNIRSLSAATVYPGTVLFEGTNLSEGRGTEAPFEWIGAPWMDAEAWAERLNAAGPPGVQFIAGERTPDSSKFSEQSCRGVVLHITDRSQLRPMEMGVTMLATARQVAGSSVQIAASAFDRLAGTDQLRKGLEASRPVADIVAGWQADLERFKARRARYLLYP